MEECAYNQTCGLGPHSLGSPSLVHKNECPCASPIFGGILLLYSPFPGIICPARSLQLRYKVRGTNGTCRPGSTLNLSERKGIYVAEPVHREVSG
jgi:hypothetical protein